MAEVIETVGRVLNGRLDLHEDAIRALNQGIRSWEGKTVRVVVRKARPTRSDAQNRFLWGVAYALLAEHTGYEAEDIHEFAKAKFLPKSLAFADGNGEVIGQYVVGGSTTRLNTVEFNDYVDRLRAWSLDTLGVVIPEPLEF